MSSAAGAAMRAFGLDRGHAVPAGRPGRGRRASCWSAATRPRPCRRPCSTWTAGRAAGALHVVVDPRRTATARAAPACTCSRCPAPTSRWPTACCTSRSPRAWSTRSTSPPGRPGSTPSAAAVGALLARPGRADHRRAGRRPPAHGLRPGARAARRSSSPPAAPSSTARAPTPRRPGSTSRSPSGCPAGRAAAGARSPGRATARAGASTGRRPTSCPATARSTTRRPGAHVAAVWGVDPDDLPAPGPSAFELLDALGTDGGVRTLLVLASNVAVSAPDARRVISRLRDLDFLAVSDFFLSETAALADVVLPSAMWAEEEGTMTNLEGRVIRRRRAVDPPGRGPRRPAAAGRAGRPARRRAPVQRRPRDGLRRAGPGPRRRPGRLLRHHLRPDRRRAGRLLALPGRAGRTRGTPRLFTERFATPDGRARFLPVEHVAAHEPTGRRLPLRADHRPGAGAVPVGHADPAHAAACS